MKKKARPHLLLSVCLFSTPSLGPVTRDAIGGGVDETRGERRRLSFRAMSSKHDGRHRRIVCPLSPPHLGLSDGRYSVRSQCIGLFLIQLISQGVMECLCQLLYIYTTCITVISACQLPTLRVMATVRIWSDSVRPVTSESGFGPDIKRPVRRIGLLLIRP